MKYDKLYEKYSFMMNGIMDEDKKNMIEFSDFLRRKLEGMNYVQVENKGEEAFLYYGRWKENEVDHFMFYLMDFMRQTKKWRLNCFRNLQMR